MGAEKNAVEGVLNPVARLVPGADGAVDLYLSPAYEDIASLYFEGDHWVVHRSRRPGPSATLRLSALRLCVPGPVGTLAGGCPARRRADL